MDVFKQKLLALRQHAYISKSVVKTLQRHNICVFRKTKRGRRAGRKRIPVHITYDRQNTHGVNNLLSHTLPVPQTGANLNNFISVKCPTAHVNINNTCPEISNTNNNTKSDRNLSILVFNPRSVGNKEIALHDLFIDEDPDIVIITESWRRDKGDEASLSHLIPNGYLHIMKNRNSKHRGGGILLIFKEHLNVKEDLVHVTTYASFEHINFTLFHHSRLFRFVAVYRPDHKKLRIPFCKVLDDLEDLLLTNCTEKGNLCIMGDFNIHVDDINDAEAIKFLALLHSVNLQQMITVPTHDEGHTLDHVITNYNDNLVGNIRVFNPGLSDHSAIVFKIQVPKPSPSKRRIKYRKTKNIDLQELGRKLQQAHLHDEIAATDDVNKQLTIFIDKLSSIFNDVAPLKTGTITVRPNCQWYNSDIRKCKRSLRKHERAYLKIKSSTHKKEFIAARNKFNKMLTDTKRRHFKTALFENKNNSRQLFKITRGLLKPYSPNTNNDPDLPESFNNFFINKVNVIRENLDNSPMPDLQDQHEVETPACTMPEFEPATEEEIICLLNKLPSKTCSNDAVPTWVLKHFSVILSPAITIIVNSSLKTGTFPSSLKHAVVKPVIKKTSLDVNDMKNYRPVSNLTAMSKIIEKVVHARLTAYLKFNNLSTVCQSAYKVNHSTETSLLRVYNDITRTIDNKECCLLVLLDLSAAFDTIDHEVLLRRLQSSFGINHVSLRWFSSYLENRTQAVVMDSVVSSPAAVVHGVPQGSILGPTLFSLYTAPISHIVKKHTLECQLYADDTQLYIPISPKSAALSIKAVQDCTTDIKNWMTVNKLKLNGDKTDIIVLGTKHMVKNLDIDVVNLCGHVIPTSPHSRNLGVIFDQHITMDIHVNNVIKTCFYQLQNISKIRYFLDDDTTKLLVNSLVTSRLDYCNSLLYGSTKKQLSKLQKVQNYAARVITQTRKSEHITPILKELHWLPIKYRIDFKILLLTYKCLNNLAPVYLSNLITPYKPTRALRSSSKSLLNVPRSSSDIGARAFSISAPTLWNSLQLNFTLSEYSFKKDLKTKLFKLAFNL